jgi:hypothetical protein
MDEKYVIPGITIITAIARCADEYFERRRQEGNRDLSLKAVIVQLDQVDILATYEDKFPITVERIFIRQNGTEYYFVESNIELFSKKMNLETFRLALHDLNNHVNQRIHLQNTTTSIVMEEPVTNQKIAPKREADRRKWRIIWNEIKPWVAIGMQPDTITLKLSDRFEDKTYIGWLPCEHTIRKIIEAGLSGSLEP